MQEVNYDMKNINISDILKIEPMRYWRSTAKSHEQLAEEMFDKKEFDAHKFVGWASVVVSVAALVILYFTR